MKQVQDLVVVSRALGAPTSAGEALPAPTAADGFDEAAQAQWRADMAILANDPRTAGGANRPTWLVRRILDESRKAKKEVVSSVGKIIVGHAPADGASQRRTTMNNAAPKTARDVMMAMYRAAEKAGFAEQLRGIKAGVYAEGNTFCLDWDHEVAALDGANCTAVVERAEAWITAYNAARWIGKV